MPARDWRQDIIDPPVAIDAQSHVAEPDTVGLGHDVIQERVDAHVVRHEQFALD